MRLSDKICAGLLLAICSFRASAAGTAFELPSIGAAARQEHHVGKIIWADLATPDLAAAERFYGALFGWNFQAIDAGGKQYAVAIVDGRPIGGLLQLAMPAGERQPAWLVFLAVRDVDAAKRIALKHGAKSVSEPRTYAGRGRQAVFVDPDGAVFAVLASKSGDPADLLAEPGDWIWSSLHTREPGQSAAFYQSVFGYDVFDLPGDGSGEHMILSSDEYARASVNSLPVTGRRHPHWLNFVRVPDAAAAASKTQALGGRVLVEPHVDRHGDKTAVLADPSGAPIGVMEWSDSETQREPK